MNLYQNKFYLNVVGYKVYYGVYSSFQHFGFYLNVVGYKVKEADDAFSRMDSFI